MEVDKVFFVLAMYVQAFAAARGDILHDLIPFFPRGLVLVCYLCPLPFPGLLSISWASNCL